MAGDHHLLDARRLTRRLVAQHYDTDASARIVHVWSSCLHVGVAVAGLYANQSGNGSGSRAAIDRVRNP